MTLDQAHECMQAQQTVFVDLYGPEFHKIPMKILDITTENHVDFFLTMIHEPSQVKVMFEIGRVFLEND